MRVKNIVGIFAIMLLALIFVMPSVSAQNSIIPIPIKLGLTAEPSTIAVGDTSSITIRLLDENDKPVVTEVDAPIELSTDIGYVPPSIVIPAGENLLLIEFTSKDPGIAVISAKSKGLISDTTSIVVTPLLTPPTGENVSSTPPQPSTGKTSIGDSVSKLPPPSGMTSIAEDEVTKIGGAPAKLMMISGSQLWVLYNGAWTMNSAAIYYGAQTYILLYNDQGQGISTEETYPNGWVDPKYWGYLNSGYKYYTFIGDAVGWHKVVAKGSITGQSNVIWIYVWPTTPWPTPTPTPYPAGEVFGFEAVFAIAGLLTVAYLLRRRK